VTEFQEASVAKLNRRAVCQALLAESRAGDANGTAGQDQQGAPPERGHASVARPRHPFQTDSRHSNTFKQVAYSLVE
jgi:hypothetical protein